MHRVFIRGLSLFLIFSVFFTFSASPALAAVTYTYDANGNMTSDGEDCYHYNEANQMDKVTKCASGETIAEYVYDYTGMRLVKKEFENGVLKKTIYSPADEYETVKQASNGATANTTYYKVNDELIAKKNPDGSITYYHNDHLGSSAVLSDETGAVVEKTSYEPYGEVKSGGTKSKFGYTGQEQDNETGLNYYNARYYDPHIHRFTQPDDIIQDPYTPQDLNRYSYVRNNPLKYTDPTGHIVWVPILIIGAGAILGATGAVASYTLENPNATWQEKAIVGTFGAVIGGAGSAATLYAATTVAASITATAVVGAGTAVAQQAVSNAVSGKPIIQSNLLKQAAVGAVTNAGVAKAVNIMKLTPTNVGRPISINLDRSFIDSVQKNSLNKINKATIPDLIVTKINIIIDSIWSIFDKNKNKNKKK